MKAQATLEFIGALILFLVVTIAVVGLTVDELPKFNSYADTAEKNLEVKRVTDLLLTSPGLHAGGENWESNPNDIEQIGLASNPMEVDKEKLEALTDDRYNYTEFVREEDLKNEYNFKFTWMPVIQTHESFTRGSPPEDLEEPNTDFYDRSDNRVHYGEIRLNDESIQFLNTAYSGDYNTTYVTSGDWDFSAKSPNGEGDNPFVLGEGELGQNFLIESINNREDRPGTSVVLSSEMGEYGRSREASEGEVIKLNRYPLMDDSASDEGLLKMEVLVW